MSKPSPSVDPRPLSEFDETLRELYLLAVSPNLQFEKKVGRLLDLGCKALGLQMGIVSNIQESRYEVLYCSGPDWAPEPGASFALSGTYCVHTFLADTVTHFHHAGASEISGHPCYRDFGLESYIGVPLVAEGKRFGTINFSSPEKRAPFNAAEVALVRFFGSWFANEWQRRVEHAHLFRQSSLFGAAFQSVADPILVLDAERRIVLANPAAERTFGYSSNELTGRQSSAIYESFESYEGRERFFETAGHEKVDSVELNFRRKNGEGFKGRTVATPLFSESREFLGYLGVVQDVSTASEQENQRNQMLSTVSHEVRAPIASIISSLTLLEMKGLQDQQKSSRWISSAVMNARRLKDLIDGILDLERASNAKAGDGFEAVDLVELIEHAAMGVEAFAEEHDVALEVYVRDVPVFVTGNKGQLIQILTNLATNAIKASPAGGVVTFGIKDEEDGFWIQDRGKGIPEEFQPILFDRFTREASSYDANKSGTGLGMSIVKAIVDHHLGDISFQTSAAEGTRFTVQLQTPVEP